MTGAQIKQARELLGWAPSKLAERARVPKATIDRAEKVLDEPPMTIERQKAVRAALEAQGVEFLADGSSVRLASSQGRSSQHHGG